MYRKRYDTLIIGGGISGLTAAYVSSNLGYQTLLVEQSETLGGNNRSFANSNGRIFDYGHHALDENRSHMTSNFFKRVLKNQYHRHTLSRGIVLDDYLFDYNLPLKDWPKPLAMRFKPTASQSNQPPNPTMDDLSQVYGKDFSDYSVNNILASYPSKQWALQQGEPPESHLDYIYPWFFPRSAGIQARDNEWEQYHDQMRLKNTQKILYPSNNGFQGFTDAIANACPSDFCTIETDGKKKSLQFNFSDENKHSIDSISLQGEEITFDRILWCAPIPALLAQTGNPVKLKPLQQLILGNFEFNDDIECKYHEILVGSLNHKINRITFPGTLAKSHRKTLQVEFYFPQGEFSMSDEEWKNSWLESLHTLGIISNNNTICSYNLTNSIAGVVTKGNFQETSQLLMEKLEKLKGNILMPFPIIGPENINRIIPNVIANTTKLLREGN